MNRLMMGFIACVLVLGQLACSDDDPATQNQDNQDNQLDDAGSVDDTNGDDQDPDVCTPRTQCEAWECGTVDDGCGDTFECGACGCVDGEAQTTGCGDCGIGALICEDGESGSGTCETPEIPGFSGECDELVWVSQREGSSQGMGTFDDPVDSLQAGLSVARSSGAVAVILGGGAAVEYEGPVLLEQRISIIGGYDNDLNRDEEQIPVIASESAPDAFEDGDVVGLAIHGVSESILLTNFTVETEDVVEYGRNNYGMHVYDSPGLTIDNVDVYAGRGGDGRDGDDGERGADGEDGSDGKDVEFEWGEGHDPDDFIGVGGENSDCSDAFGGDGGVGATDEPATDGEDALIASGGAGGDGTTDDGWVEENAAGGDGENAPLVTSSGDHGTGGTSDGEVVAELWVPDGNGGNGYKGEHATGGGGGGGGGMYEEGVARPTSRSSFGGGGGAGGCGGDGGEGGQGGGGSFGLFVISGDINIVSSGFFANLGGAGGAGGMGGDGGQGGTGGGPSEKMVTNPGGGDEWEDFYYVDGEKGGHGGDGADGARGGDGGGGAGGVSYGAYCQGAEIDTSGTIRFSDGGSASGGSSPTHPGDPGTAADEAGCL